MGQFEEQMSTAIIEEHLSEIKDRYSEIKNAMSRSGSSTVISGVKALHAAGVTNINDYQSQGYSCRLNSAQFLALPDIIKKLGFETRMQEILESKSSRLKTLNTTRKPFQESLVPVNGVDRTQRMREPSPKGKPANHVTSRADPTVAKQQSDYYRSSFPDQLHFGNSGNQDDSEASGTEAFKSSWANIAQMIFELDDQFYVHEDKELLFEIDQNARRMIFRRSSEENSHDQFEDDDDEFSKTTIVKLNKEFLEQGDATFQDDLHELGLSDSDDGPLTLPGELPAPWFIDLVEDKSIFESQTGSKFSASLYDERSPMLKVLKASPVPKNINLPQAVTGKKKKMRLGYHEEIPTNSGQVFFTQDDLLYKVDPEILANLRKSKKPPEPSASQPTASQTQSILESAPEVQEQPQIQQAKANPSLLIHHIDPNLLEKEEAAPRSSSEEISISPNKNGGGSKPTAAKVEVEDSSKAGKTVKKNKKGKKATGTLVLIDDETEDKPSGLLGSLISGKKQSKKAKQAAKQQKLLAEAAKQQKEEFNLDEVSEIQHDRSAEGEILGESLENPMVDEIDVPRQSTRELHISPKDSRPQETLFLDEEPHRAEVEEVQTEPRESSEGADKKKRKKKAKKGAQTTTKTLPNGKIDPLFEELSQPDKEKDTNITYVDSILRKAGHENIASLILQVLDNESMSEEFFVDKRKYYTKYVYVADALAGVPGNEKGLVLPNK